MFVYQFASLTPLEFFIVQYTLYFISLIHSNNPLILGQDNSNVPRLLQIFTKVIEEDALVDSPETYNRVLNLCRHIQVRDVWISDGVVMFVCFISHQGVYGQPV